MREERCCCAWRAVIEPTIGARGIPSGTAQSPPVVTDGSVGVRTRHRDSTVDPWEFLATATPSTRHTAEP